MPLARPTPTLPLLLATLALAGAAPLRAETALTPFAGVAFGGRTDDSKFTYGGALAFRGSGTGLGFEIDFGYTPDFFGETGRLSENSVTTLMGSLLFLAGGNTRLYGAAGLGLLKTRVQDVDGFFDVDSNDFGFNVGGGLEIGLGENFGLRGDLRYLRALTDPEPDDEFDVDLADLDFFRATGGLTIKF
jgi:opacity protein-like surface antigen